MQNPISWIVGIVLAMILVVQFVSDSVTPFETQQNLLVHNNTSLIKSVNGEVRNK